MKAFDRLDRALVLLRTRAGLKQMELAKRAGITPSMISEYESGKKSPHVDTLDKILEVLELDAHGLAAALRTAQQEATEERLRREAEADRHQGHPMLRARTRAMTALADMSTAFDALTRAIEDLLLAQAEAED